MALTVEDGTLVADADAYVSTAEVDTYNTNYVGDTTWSGATDTAKEIAVRQATQFIDSKFASRFVGVLSDNDQSLMWPRAGAIGHDGRSYDDDDIPDQLKNAVYELAIKATAEDLVPDIDTPGDVRRTKDAVGPLSTEVEYFGASQEKLYNLAMKILDPLIDGGTAQISVSRS